jgi:UDP-glucose 4-epimerase
MVPGCGYDEYKQEFEQVIFPTVRLMQLCSRLDVQFVYFSSGGTVYGERKTLTPFVETDPKEPISYYGLSKQMIENSILFEHRMSNLSYLILRPSNPYGQGQNLHGRQGLIAVALGKILAGEPITIWGDGSSVRDYIYIDDLAKVVVKLLKMDVSNMTINIGSSKGYSIKEIIMVLSEIAEEDIRVKYTPSRKNDVSNMVLDTSMLKSLVNIKLTPLEEGVKKFYKHEKDLLKNG